MEHDSFILAPAQATNTTDGNWTPLKIVADLGSRLKKVKGRFRVHALTGFSERDYALMQCDGKAKAEDSQSQCLKTICRPQSDLKPCHEVQGV